MMVHENATEAWLTALSRILENGEKFREALHVPSNAIAFNMRFPVVDLKARGLLWRYLSRLALWTLEGDNRVETLSPSNPHVVSFSDDGETLAGAYGPSFVDQVPYVLSCLEVLGDQHAAMSFWKPKPRVGKDMPEVLSVVFHIRERKLDLHAFAGTSNIWFAPYELFTLSIMAAFVASHLNGRTGYGVDLGACYWTAANAFLEVGTVEAGDDCLAEGAQNAADHHRLPARWLSAPGPLADALIMSAAPRGSGEPPIWLYPEKV